MATTLTGTPISTAFKKIVFTDATSGVSGKLYYTLDSDGVTDTELTTLASKMSFTLGIQLSNGIVYDSGGNESIQLTATGSAVNHLGLTNAATGNAVTLTTLGGDSNVGLTLTPKGTGVVTCTPKLVATAGIELDNNIIYASDGATAITTTASSGNVLVAGTLTSTGDLTISGDDIVIGGSDDATDKSINFRHDTCEVFMGIDDSQESNAGAFIIHTGTGFQATKLDNDFLIDGSGNVHIGNGELRITKIAYTDGDDALTVNDGGSLTSAGALTLGGNLVIPNSGNIGSASDTNAIAISADGTVTLTQNIVVSGVGGNTFTGKVALNGNTGPTNGAGIDTDGSRHHSWSQKIGGVTKTSIYVDLEGLASSTTDKDIIGLAAGGVAHIGYITSADHGSIFAVKMTCLEAPTTGADDIDLYNANEGTYIFDNPLVSTSGTEYLIVDGGGAWTNGMVKGGTTITFGSAEYLYLTGGEAGTAGTYGAGKFLIELWGA